MVGREVRLSSSLYTPTVKEGKYRRHSKGRKGVEGTRYYEESKPSPSNPS